MADNSMGGIYSRRRGGAGAVNRGYDELEPPKSRARKSPAKKAPASKKAPAKKSPAAKKAPAKKATAPKLAAQRGSEQNPTGGPSKED